MDLAGVVNMLMLIVAASLFYRHGLDVQTLQGAHAELDALAGNRAARAFALALLASGLASTSVGTYAGQVVTQGFLDRTIPLVLRRLITMAPSLAILAIGIDARADHLPGHAQFGDPVRARSAGVADRSP
jgi:manganese transport protein